MNIVCKECGRSTDVPDLDIPDEMKRVLQIDGVICPMCQMKKELIAKYDLPGSMNQEEQWATPDLFLTTILYGSLKEQVIS